MAYQLSFSSEAVKDIQKLDTVIQKRLQKKFTEIAENNDIKKIAKQLGYEFDGVNAPADSKGYYTLGYSQFVVPLVQAVKEQQTQIQQLQKDKATLQQQLDAILKRLELLEKK